jgi:hypothetical protein
MYRPFMRREDMCATAQGEQEQTVASFDRSERKRRRYLREIGMRTADFAGSSYAIRPRERENLLIDTFASATGCTSTLQKERLSPTAPLAQLVNIRGFFRNFERTAASSQMRIVPDAELAIRQLASVLTSGAASEEEVIGALRHWSRVVVEHRQQTHAVVRTADESRSGQAIDDIVEVSATARAKLFGRSAAS